jgi:hypothetical protein
MERVLHVLVLELKLHFSQKPFRYRYRALISQSMKGPFLFHLVTENLDDPQTQRQSPCLVSSFEVPSEAPACSLPSRSPRILEQTLPCCTTASTVLRYVHFM